MNQKLKRVTVYIFTLALVATSCTARRTTVVFMSTAKAEYGADVKADMEAMSLQNILIEVLHDMKVSINIAISKRRLCLPHTPLKSDEQDKSRLSGTPFVI